MAILKTEVPRFEEGEKLTAKVEKLVSYLEQLQAALNFTLGNLGPTNMNSKGLSIPVQSADGNSELGSLGAVEGGVGLSSGTAALRVTREGVQVTTDGKTWRTI